MEFMEVIYSRRSVRKYLQERIPREKIEEILSLALDNTPSAGNRQPWMVYATDDTEIKRALVRCAYGQKFIEEAAWVAVVCALPAESAGRYGERGATLYAIQDTASLITHIMLIARNFGYDTCWVGAFNEDEAKKVLKLPPDQRPVAIIPIGVGGEKPTKPPRKRKEDVLKFL